MNDPEFEDMIIQEPGDLVAKPSHTRQEAAFLYNGAIKYSKIMKYIGIVFFTLSICGIAMTIPFFIGLGPPVFKNMLIGNFEASISER